MLPDPVPADQPDFPYGRSCWGAGPSLGEEQEGKERRPRSCREGPSALRAAGAKSTAHVAAL